MSKEEFLKIQTCILKVNIHCDGCKQKVKKILQKIDGVYTTKIDSEQGKVTVSGNVDPATLIKKLTKNGKHAELWGAPKPSNNQNQNQVKNLKIDNGKGGNNKGQPQKGGGGGGSNNQPKGGGGGAAPGQNLQLQQLQQMKGFQDLKMPAPQFMKDMKMPVGNNPNQMQKPPMKLSLPEDEGLSDDEFDDYDDDDDEYDDEDDDDLEDDLDIGPLNKMKPMMGNGQGGPQMPNMLMQNMMNAQMMKGGGNNGGNNAGNGNKGGSDGNMPVKLNFGGGGTSGGGSGGANEGKGGANGGKKGGNGGNSGNQNQGGGKGGKSGQPQGGGQNKNGVGSGGGAPPNMNDFMANGMKKGGGMNDGPQGMPKMMPMNGGANVGHMGNMPMGPMGSLPISQMSNLAAVQGLPAMNGGGGNGGAAAGGGGAAYFQGAGPESMAGNPFYQQQMAAMMMNQQRANGNERFQPMMYARPPPAVNYMPPYPPYPYPYPYPPPPGERADQYSMFSDENTASCSVM